MIATLDPALGRVEEGISVTDGQQPPRSGDVYRHPLPVRLWHWTNALCVILLLLSGFQIFNAHPRLYVGATGYYDTHAVFEIAGVPDLQHPRSWVRIGSAHIPSTGVFGVAERTPLGVRNMAFPAWLRLPSIDHLGLGRAWHFMMAWLLVFNIAAYFIYLVSSGRLRRVLLPERAQLVLRAIGRDLWMHLRLRHPSGAEALKYNFLQKLSYLAVILLFLPTMVATGMTMSPSALAAFPWLVDLFGGRQTARTIHFIVAMLIAAFILVHLFQVLVAGFYREMRSMITGYYAPPKETSR